MKNKLTLLMGLTTSALMVSCYPPQNTAPTTQATARQAPVEQNSPNTNVGVDSNRVEELEAFQRENGLTESNTSDTSRSITETKPKVTETPPKPAPKPTSPADITPDLPPLPDTPDPTPVVKKKAFPFAAPVPAKPGFVFNPYNQKKVDVRGLPSGTLVSDPRDEAQKFYVP